MLEKGHFGEKWQFCELWVKKGGFKNCQNVSKLYMQLFFMYIKRYRGQEENFENFSLKWVPLMAIAPPHEESKVWNKQLF